MTEFKLRWGGLIEALIDETGDTEYISELRKKLKAVEESKNEIEFFKARDRFSAYDKNYLNSPVLDNLFFTHFYKVYFAVCRKKILQHLMNIKTVEFVPNIILKKILNGL